MFRVPNLFQILVNSTLPASLVCVNGLSQNLRPLTLQSMARWTKSDSRQDSQHEKQRLGRPKR